MPALSSPKFYLTPSVLQEPLREACTTQRTEQGVSCPACGSPIVEIRHKRVCQKCHTICETCCEGGRG